MKKRRRLVFMGTSLFAVPVLEKLAAEHDVLLVISQPDRKVGRKQLLSASPIKQKALELGYEVYQPEKLNNELSLKKLRDLEPDLIIVVAYGHILKSEVLAIPKEGSINVHASLLPKYRGASPIQSAILAGEKETGVSIMFVDEGLDTGPVIQQACLEITVKDDYLSLEKKLALLGAETLLDALMKKNLAANPQDEKLASFCKTIAKDDGLLEFKLNTAEELERKIRAFAAWPQTFCFWNGRRLKILAADIEKKEAEPGRVILENGILKIGCLQGTLIPSALQLEGKKTMNVSNFLMGYSDFVGALL